MIEAIKNTASGFFPMVKTDKWQVAYITYSDAYGDLKELKRHMTTDEVILLIRGNATLYTYENSKISSIAIKNDGIYNIKKATWHHLKISKDALLIAVENSDITKETTERMTVNADC